VPDVGDDFDFVEFRGMGQQFFCRNRSLGEISLTQSPGCLHVEPVRFFIENSEQSAFGVQHIGGFGYDNIQHFLETGAGVHRADDVVENMEIVFNFC
jgi:hypothetical protein